MTHLTKDRPKSFKRAKRSISATKSNEGDQVKSSSSSPTSLKEEAFLQTVNQPPAPKQRQDRTDSDVSNGRYKVNVDGPKTFSNSPDSPSKVKFPTQSVNNNEVFEVKSPAQSKSDDEPKYSYPTKKEPPSSPATSQQTEEPLPQASTKFNKGGFGRGSFRLPGLDELRGKTLRKTISTPSSSSKNSKESVTPLLEAQKSSSVTSTLTRKKNKKSGDSGGPGGVVDGDGTTTKGFFNNKRGGSVRLKSENSASPPSSGDQHKLVKRSFSTGGGRDVKSLRERLESGGNSLRSGISRIGSSVSSRTQPRIAKKASMEESEKLISEDPDENTDFLVKIKDDKKTKEKEQQLQQMQTPKEKRRIIGGQSVARITSHKAQPRTPSYKKLDSDNSSGSSQPSSPKSPSNEPLAEFYKPRSVSPKLSRKEEGDANAHALEKKEVKFTTSKSKSEWSLEERKLWEKQKLEESERQYKMSKMSGSNLSKNNDDVKSHSTPGMSQEVIKRNRRNIQESQATETNNIMTDEKRIFSSKNMNTTHVDYKKPDPSSTPQQSNNDKPLKAKQTEQTVINSGTSTKYGVSDSIYGNSRQEERISSRTSPPPNSSTDKFSSHQGQTISGVKDSEAKEISSYNAVQVQKSFSIKSFTPKLGRRARKVDENGRILDKKGCAQRNIVGSLLGFPSSKNSSPAQTGKDQQQQQQQQQTGGQDSEDEMQTELYEKKIKQTNASKESETSWLGKSGLIDIDSTSTPAKNTFKTRDDTTQSPSDSNNDNYSNSNNNNHNANKQQNSGERQRLLQDEESDSDEDACLDRSILINDRKNRKSKDDREKSTGAKKTSKITGGLSFRKKYNFDKL